MDNDTASRELVKKINNASKLHKQDYKSKLITEKYSLLPINPQQLTSVQPYKEYQRNTLIFRYKLLTPLDPQKLNIQEPPSHWC